MVKKAIVLVAGFEPNLSPYSDEMHQCMFNLGEKTVLESLLDKLSNKGIEEVVLLVGHKKETIKEKIKNKYKNIKIKYIENKDYLTTKTAYSLYLASNELKDDFLLIDGDMIVEEDFIGDLIKDKRKNLLAVDFSNTQKENIAVVKLVNQKVTGVGKDIKKLDDKYFARFLGISKFSADFAKKLKEKVQNYAKNNEFNKIYENAVSELCADNKIEVFNSRKYNWFEIDTISEFEKAKKIYGDTEDLKQKAFDFGADDAYIVLPSELIFDDRAILQCFNCKNFGNKRTCPPFTMKIDYESMFKKYKKGLFVLVRFDSSVDFAKARVESTNKLHRILLKLEKQAFTQDNHFTTSFIGGSCKLCPQGCDEKACRNPAMSRIPLESTGVDVVETLKKFGQELRFPAKDEIYRVGLLLIG